MITIALAQVETDDINRSMADAKKAFDEAMVPLQRRREKLKLICPHRIDMVRLKKKQGQVGVCDICGFDGLTGK